MGKKSSNTTSTSATDATVTKDTSKVSKDSSESKATKASKATAVPKAAGKKTRSKSVSTPVTEIKFEFSRLPRAPLLRIIKDMAHKIDPEARVQAHVLDRYEQIIQQYVSNLVTSTVMAAQKEKRKTIMVKDLDFILQIQGGGKPVNFSSAVSVSADASVAAPSTASSN